MFETDISLAKYSNFQIGGPAAYFFQAENVESILAATKKAKELALPIFIFGGATNLLISDQGFPGLVLKPTLKTIRREGTAITVGAGALVSEVLEYCAKEGLAGLEWAGGLPGSIGGAVFGNAGAFGGEMKDSVVGVLSLDLAKEEPKLIFRTDLDCAFGYRTSIFKTGRQNGTNEVILEIIFDLEQGDQTQIQKIIQEKIEYRQNRQPLEYPNIGSIFKNIPIEQVPEKTLQFFEHKIKTDPFPVLPNAVLADAAKLKGRTIGGAQISPKHPNFIVNLGNATASDVQNLMAIFQKEIQDQFGVEIEQEVIDLQESL